MAYEETYKSQEHLTRIIEKKQRQQDAAAAALEAKIDRKRIGEYKHSFDISHERRQELFSAWLWSRNKGFPINTFLQFEFPFDPHDQRDNVDKVRSVAHHCLMYLRRRGKIPSHLQWSRFVSLKEAKELCTVILHVPEKFYEDFRAYASKWDGHNIAVQQCSYDREWTVDDTGTLVTVFDILTKATTKTTQHKLKGVYSEESDIIYRPRTFTSEKLSKEDIAREFKAYQVMKEMENLGNAVKMKD